MATQIQTFAISNLTLGAHYDFHMSVLNLITELTPEALHIEALVEKYARLLADEENIINRSTTYVSTAVKKAADTKRDRAGGVIMNVTDAHCTNPNPVHSEPAVKLKAKLAPYRGIWQHEYSKQTSEVNGMIKLLRSAECAPWVTALHLDTELDILEEGNAEAKAAKEGKIDEKIDRLPQTDINTDELRKEVDKVYAEIIQLINAYELIQPSEASHTFVVRVNVNVDYYKDILDQAANKPEYNPDGGEGTTPDDGSDSGTDGGDTSGGSGSGEGDSSGSDEGDGSGSGEGDGSGSGEGGGETPTPDPTPGGGDDDDGGSLVG